MCEHVAEKLTESSEIGNSFKPSESIILMEIDCDKFVWYSSIVQNFSKKKMNERHLYADISQFFEICTIYSTECVKSVNKIYFLHLALNVCHSYVSRR